MARAVKASKMSKSTKEKAVSMKVLTLSGKDTSEKALPSEIFAVEHAKETVAQYIRIYLQNQRQGTQSTKTRAEVIGSTKKIYRQKGTGGARHGARKAPIFVGGGITFGPKPRDYSLKMNKKQKRIALFSSLSLKAENNSIVGLQIADKEIAAPKTKTVAEFLKKNEMNDKKVLLVTPDSYKDNLYISAKNIENVTIADVKHLNAYTVMAHENVIMLVDSIQSLQDHYFPKQA
jgi:large subunit ribosomal protein L4